jgi:hypothetical protein
MKSELTHQPIFLEPAEMSETPLPLANMKACPGCGASTETWSHVCPHCEYEWKEGGEPPVEASLWNPMSAFGWSLLFGPLFGAILLDRNWRNLGQAEHGRTARFFLWACIAFWGLVIVTIPMDFGPAGDKAVAGAFKILGIVLYAVCGSLARSQRNYLAGTFGGTYSKRPWFKPLAIGFGCLVPVLALIVLGTFQDPLLCRMVEREAQPILVQEFSNRPMYQGVSIRKVTFDHHQGNDYEGRMVVHTSSGESTVPLKAHLEGGQLLVNWPINLSSSW